jgi:hypothetical protein
LRLCSDVSIGASITMRVVRWRLMITDGADTRRRIFVIVFG